MTYQIIRGYPLHDWSTDAIIGTGYCPLPMTYYSKALALKLAARLHQQAYDGCGDDHYEVISTVTGKRVWHEREPGFAVMLDDDMPF